MAILVAVAGAGLGSAVGIGASAGWIIGSIVGGLLFPPPGVTNEGPRLGDLSVTSSTYGTPIQKSFGTIRMAGNMIWSTGIEEVKSTKKQSGGKGGGASQTQVTYEYFSTFAIAFGEGEADDVTRLWADGKLIFDKTGSGDEITKVDLNFRFYPGSETQEPDGLIEDDQGVDQTPAFRGICYLVFDRTPLKDFGNRIPNFTAEVTFNGSTSQTTTETDFFTVAEGGLTDGFSGSDILPDYNRSVHYMTVASATVGQNYIRRFQTRTMVEDRQKQYTTDTNAEDVISFEMVAILNSGNLICSGGTGNGRPVYLINPDSLEIVDTFGDNTGTGFFSNVQFPAPRAGYNCGIRLQGATGPEEYYLATETAATGSTTEFGILSVTDSSLAYVYDTDSANVTISGSRVRGTCQGAIGEGFGEAYFLGRNNATTSDANFYKITVSSGASYSTVSSTSRGVSVELIASLSPDDLVSGATDASTFRGLVYDAVDDTIMFQFNESGSARMAKLDPSTGTLLWVTTLGISGINVNQGFNVGRVTGGVYGQVSGGSSIALRTATGEIFETQSGWLPQTNTSGAGWWDGSSSIYYSFSSVPTSPNIVKYPFFRGSGGGTALSTIITSICEDAGYDASDLNVTELTSTIVPGYTIGRQTTARNAIQPLATAYFFDGVESDFLLNFLLRDGKTSVATITQDELALLDDNTGDFFQESRVQDVELPKRFTVTYLDSENDYLQGAQSSKRIFNPTPTSNSQNEMGLQIAAAFTSEFAKQITEKQLYSAWIERSNYNITIPWKYLAIDPTDIITITTDDGDIFRTRVITCDIGAGFTMEVSSISNEAPQYTSTVEADAGTGVPEQTFLGIENTKLIMLCSPLLRDSDDTVRTVSQLYYFMGGFGQPGWTAGTLFKSAEGTEYSDVGSVVGEMAWGSAANALGDTDLPFSTDETNTLKIFMNTGGSKIVSATQLEMVNGANAAALIHTNGIDAEIIQFRDVVTNDDGSFTLSGLLRGRRGSESFTDSHSVGDTFLLLEADTGDSTHLSLSEINSSRYYRAVTTGQMFEDADTITKASPGNDLKPWAPAQQVATASGNDIIFTWVRRTRIGGGLQDGSGIVPLNEDTEEYEVDVYNAAGTAIVHTETGLTSPTWTFTSTEQSDAGLSPPLSEVIVEIYQISAQVGRGFTKKVTLDVE